MEIFLTEIFSVWLYQDALDGEYNKKQSWSGLVTQHNLWDFSIEEYDIENLAECRSDAFGNIVKYMNILNMSSVGRIWVMA